MKGSYLWNVGGKISEIRLIIEGAVTLYEEDASGINKMMMDAGNLTAAAGFDTIGEALYELLTHFRSMKEGQAHWQTEKQSGQHSSDILQTLSCICGRKYECE